MDKGIGGVIVSGGVQVGKTLDVLHRYCQRVIFMVSNFDF